MKKVIFSLFVALGFFVMNKGSFAQVRVGPFPANYTNLQAAFLAINTPPYVHGPAPTVTITASYTEPGIAELTGVGITSCRIYTDGAYTITGNVNNPVILLNGANNVTIDGRIGQTGSTRSLTITNNNPGTSNSIITWRNGASNGTVRYINAIGPTGFGRLLSIGQSDPNTAGCNNNTIEYNSIERGARGVQVFGTPSGVNSFTNDNTAIRGNIVKNQTAYGILIGSYVKDVQCTGNQLFFDAAVLTTQTSFIAIQNQGVGTINISNNKIYGMENSGAPNATYRGSISLPVSIAPLPDPITTADYINNMISIVTNNSTALFAGACIQTQASAAAQFVSCTFRVLHNTLYFGGSSNVATDAGEYCYLANVVTPLGTQLYNLVLKNNIFKNMRSGGSTGAFHIAAGYESSANLNVDADYNLAYAGGTTANSWAYEYGSFLYPNDAIYALKQNLCFIPAEQHTAFKDVNLVTETNLHIAGPVGGDLCGTWVGVPADIDGTSRHLMYPWKGAHEYGTFKLLTLGAKLEAVSTAADVRVVLRDYLCRVVSTCNADVNGTGVFAFGDLVANGTNYWLDVNSLTHLRTVSSTQQSFTAGALLYDFRTAQTKAFGNNMMQDGGNWAFYGGDANQDGTIDASDLSLIDNDALIFVGGCYLKTDINHDGIVEGSDLSITDNNAADFVIVATPCPEPVAPVTGPSPSYRSASSSTTSTEVKAAE